MFESLLLDQKLSLVVSIQSTKIPKQQVVGKCLMLKLLKAASRSLSNQLTTYVLKLPSRFSCGLHTSVHKSKWEMHFQRKLQIQIGSQNTQLSCYHITLFFFQLILLFDIACKTISKKKLQQFFFAKLTENQNGGLSIIIIIRARFSAHDGREVVVARLQSGYSSTHTANGQVLLAGGPRVGHRPQQLRS